MVKKTATLSPAFSKFIRSRAIHSVGSLLHLRGATCAACYRLRNRRQFLLKLAPLLRLRKRLFYLRF